jgi:hypothetical protein
MLETQITFLRLKKGSFESKFEQLVQMLNMLLLNQFKKIVFNNRRTMFKVKRRLFGVLYRKI